MIHIGNLIREEMQRQGRSPAWLAKAINCQRPNVYYIYSQAAINTELLARISQALKVDFFKYLSHDLEL